MSGVGSDEGIKASKESLSVLGSSGGISAGKFLSQVKRTHYCGALRETHVGETVVLMGWVDTRRDHGGLVFVDLRDRTGLVQVTLNSQEEALKSAKDFRNEYVVAIQGKVQSRPEGMNNANMDTGKIEVVAESCEILSSAKTPPFQVDDEKVTETLRLKYRYLDLRSPRLQKYMITRHQVMQFVRQELCEQGFLEIETPILYKSTPEGARDYLVPSRVFPGQFYALPQSPQTLKQLLMISGMDRYFQIARCFRDEDLRADRQPEFSQIDIEMSFVEQEDVMASTEKLLRQVWKRVRGVDVGVVDHLTYDEAMSRFGIDRPDLRIPWELKDLGKVVIGSGFKVFDDVVARHGAVKGLAISGPGEFSRGQFDRWTTMAKQMGAKGLVWIKSTQGGELSSPVSKFFSPDKLKEIFESAGGVPGGAVLIVADDFKVTCSSLGFLRQHLAKELNAIDESRDRFLWVTDFPLLEYSPEDGRWVAVHHPFTAPANEDLPKLMSGDSSQFSSLKAKAYDLVCNGYEIAGGSVRIHNTDVQAVIFKALGLGPEEIQEKFGFFVEALSYGTPPHGGIAWGLDRLLMILCGTEAIRDVIAFPKTTKASDLMASAPSPVAQDQLLELGIRLRTLGNDKNEKNT